MAPMDMSRNGFGWSVSPETRISAIEKGGAFTVYEVLEVGSNIGYAIDDYNPSDGIQITKVPIPGIVTHTCESLE